MLQAVLVTCLLGSRRRASNQINVAPAPCFTEPVKLKLVPKAVPVLAWNHAPSPSQNHPNATLYDLTELTFGLVQAVASTPGSLSASQHAVCKPIWKQKLFHKEHLRLGESYKSSPTTSKGHYLAALSCLLLHIPRYHAHLPTRHHPNSSIGAFARRVNKFKPKVCQIWTCMRPYCVHYTLEMHASKSIKHPVNHCQECRRGRAPLRRPPPRPGPEAPRCVGQRGIPLAPHCSHEARPRSTWSWSCGGLFGRRHGRTARGAGEHAGSSAAAGLQAEGESQGKVATIQWNVLGLGWNVSWKRLLWR